MMNIFKHINQQSEVCKSYGLLAVVSLTLTAFASPASAQCLPNELQKLTAADATFGDKFGNSVCIVGDLAISGAPWANVEQYLAGAVYVYRKDPITNQWIEEQKVVPEDLGPLDWFGRSVAINPLDPNMIIVGAWANDDADDCGKNAVCESGSAYIFCFDTDLGLWIQEQKLTASDADSQDRFGWAVSIWGDVAMVGAKLDDDPEQDTGSVYVFCYDPETKIWVEQQKLIPPNQGRFGNSISLQNDLALIGAFADSEEAFQGGAVYVYRYDPKTQLWDQEQKLQPSDPVSGAVFGNSVSLSGDFAIIGAPMHRVNGLGGAGAVYVFEYNGAQWIERQLLTAAVPGFFNVFGWSVSLQDNIAVIGTPRGDDGDSVAGSASIFVYDPDTLLWTEQATLHSSDLETGDFFGGSVSIDAGRVVSGARGNADAGSESGSAYIFGGLGDCNNNGIIDICDIADGNAIDNNNNGIPDECEPDQCPWDLDGSGSVGASDLITLFAQWGTAGSADFDGNGFVGTSDLLILFANWGPCE